MSDKKNQLWRLDLLESHFLEKPVRFQRTKSLLRVKGKSKSNLLPESKDRALQEIEALRSDIFAKKLHSSLVKCNRVVKKTVKSAAADKKVKDEEKKFLQSLDVEQISNIRIIKLASNVYKLNAKRLASEPSLKPSFLPQWIVDSLVDKTSQFNPSRFYNEMTNDQRNWYSKLMNHKDIQSVVDIVENSFKIILGAVKKADDIEDVETSESEEEEEEEEEKAEEADSEDSENESEDEQIDGDDDFSMYDKYLAGTDDEEDDEVELDPTIDYNQVTDEEASEDEEEQASDLKTKKKSLKSSAETDDFFDFEAEEKPRKEKKTKEDKKKEKKADKTKQKKVSLPELQGGFISGSDDSDIEDDKVVQEITGATKKNRRGQRARQKIWEQKFGRGANHVKKDKEEKQKMREQKQREWEEREAKRQAKAAEMTGANSSKLGARKPLSGDGKTVAPVVSTTPALHPSWEAKKKQDAALKNAKFQGKKVVF